VAYVPAAELIEVAAADPKLGVVFYTLEQKPSPRPRLARDNRCLECHASSKTLEVPGLLVRSFLTKADGEVDLLSGVLVTHRTPIAERWGGYYVSGTYGSQTHRGNLFGAQAFARHQQDPSWNANITDLTPFLDVTKYPDSGSDIVALLVLEHQAHMQALLTRLNYDVGNALRAGAEVHQAGPAFEAVLKYMLFVDEARLAGPVRGTSGFARWFEEQGPKDKQGRSLRQLDLQSRLFKFPCSFMVYSSSFDALPAPALKHLYSRLLEILSGEDQSPDYRMLTPAMRKSIRDILSETKTDLPIAWRL